MWTNAVFGCAQIEYPAARQCFRCQYLLTSGQVNLSNTSSSDSITPI
jgi:hypothetical protein